MAKKVLVIDDEPDIGLLLEARISSKGYDVLVAQDGLEGLERAAKEQPALIILDILMPRMDGHQVLKQLKSQPETKNIPVIGLTASVATTHMGTFIAEGGVDCLTKPFEPVELLDKITKVI